MVGCWVRRCGIKFSWPVLDRLSKCNQILNAWSQWAGCTIHSRAFFRKVKLRNTNILIECKVEKSAYEPEP
jgi:hypothetical protein